MGRNRTLKRKQSTQKTKINKQKWYRRGKDYPPYKDNVKLPIAMKGSELLQWFTEEELKEYPKPEAYTGSLP